MLCTGANAAVSSRLVPVVPPVCWFRVTCGREKTKAGQESLAQAQARGWARLCPGGQEGTVGDLSPVRMCECPAQKRQEQWAPRSQRAGGGLVWPRKLRGWPGLLPSGLYLDHLHTHVWGFYLKTFSITPTSIRAVGFTLQIKC